MMQRLFPVFMTTLFFMMHKPDACNGSKILVVPLDGSHWINMEVILRELHSRGHNITVLHSANSWYIPGNSSIYTSVHVHMLEDEVDKNFYNEMLLNVMECRKLPGFMHSFCQQHLITSMFSVGHNIIARALATMMDDPVFMKRLQDAKFEVMLTDPGIPIGVLLGAFLQLPMVFNVRWLNTGECHSTIAPSPLSYVPVSGTELHDKMTFLERLRNSLHYLHSVVEQYFIINPPYSDLLRRHFPAGTDLLSLQRNAAIWLVRSDFVFEFPRPTMPNVVYIGGFQCKPALPLSTELEAFVQSSGEHGVVIMSLGTLVSALPHEVMNAIAAAFAMLPQKVVWRFEGPPPPTLGSNTLLVKWLPQNDLLGHPKTRAFVTHGGTNSVYEAIYHGVPVLGLPLLFDQFDNLLRLKVRGAACLVEAKSLTKQEFLEAMKEILETPFYRNNMQHLSKLHRDQPISPMDAAIFWIEYVIQNKGAAHLCSAAFSLPWYSYHSLDVAVFVLALIGTSVCIIVSMCWCLCCQKYNRKIKSE
ncbi:UDP glucuronosyltransferase 5 family, polypeptide G1 [Thalassophryne amazonica]|uniref:UDP glucuronosyltransferase 5 family, polypeptide G1 n=1 Tax=Thalassophryne amazonica TaxID=390379 RepID=UPI0014724CF7|nr:UDP glucuronosyltransferase 5 family, polypeptide G1 [Thalassophryne amazonica]